VLQGTPLLLIVFNRIDQFGFDREDIRQIIKSAGADLNVANFEQFPISANVRETDWFLPVAREALPDDV
jgi:hypothetical protein